MRREQLVFCDRTLAQKLVISPLLFSSAETCNPNVFARRALAPDIAAAPPEDFRALLSQASATLRRL